MANKSEKLLCDLIAIPSVNPAFLSPDDPRGGETRVAQFLADRAVRAGLDIDWQPVFPRRSNLLVSLKPRDRVERRIVLAPHLDTVGNDEMPKHCFLPRIERDRLFGRGACDTKGSAAAMFNAVCALAENGERPKETEILFVGLMDEENAQEGSRAFARSQIKADLAIVGEPTQLKVVTAHKGDLWIKLITRGKAAHGARPELGENAVHEMARVIDLLETKYAASLRKRRHPVVGHPTINVGAVRGGTQANIVPDCCEILIDRRTIPGEKDSAVLKEIVRFIRDAGLKIELVNFKQNECASMETSPKLPLVQQFMRTTGQHKAVGVDFFCDAAIISQGGTPSVVFGPGNIAQAHTADEWISINSLESATRILEKFLRSLP
jgi:acetylornithine deacetylase/succinyl-diaminopimelate desuccinylase-like protein